MKRLPGILTTLFASRAFFVGTLVFFVLQALWFVFSAVYPMAFDEEVHVGIIRVYSEQWSPFLNGQETSSDAFGAIIADPSYFYHYLMSFPYRLLTGMTDSETAQIIVLRLINVTIFAYALAVFRKVLREAGTSAALSNVAIALFTLVPIVPMLAAHVNYDNLLMLIVAWLCLLGMRLMRSLQSRAVELRDWWLLALLCLFGGIVKYAVLPILAGAVVALLVYAWWQFRGSRKLFLSRMRKSWRGFSRRALIVGVLLVVIGGGLFMQRYGVNMVKYGHPVPACDAVLGEERCTAYGPWNRNHLLAQTKGDVNENPVRYAGVWLHAMWTRMFFAVNGPASLYATRPALPVPAGTAIVLGLGLFAAVFGARQRIWRRPVLLYFAGFIAVYVALLWLEDYSQFVETGQPVAINGRYLLPILLPLAAVFGAAVSYVLRQRPNLKAYLAAGVLVLFLHGGGVFTFISRSDVTWNWPSNAVVKVNDAARRLTSFFIFEGKRYY